VIKPLNSGCLSSGSLPIAPDRPWLAPLAGYSDLPFRLLCRLWGISVACTEMVSAKGLFYSTANTLQLLKTSDADSPLVVQIYGSDVPTVKTAMDRLLDLGFGYFDLNCGCAVKKVIKTGSGAALLKNPGLLLDMASAMVGKAGTGRVGVKMRSGWNSHTPVYLELAEPLSRIGVGWIALHPRTAVQLFTGRASWQDLKKLKEFSKVPVIASGDLFTAEDALKCIEQTGVDSVMFARGALMDPAIAGRYMNLLQGMNDLPRNKEFLQQLCLQAVEIYRRHSHSSRTVLRLRSLLPRMLRGMPGARELRKKIIACKNWDEMTDVLMTMTDAEETP